LDPAGTSGSPSPPESAGAAASLDSREKTDAGPELDDETLALAHELFEIVRAGDTQRVTQLLEMGLAPNLRNSKGDSLLMLAAYHGHTSLVEALLRHGADPELPNERGQTPLAGAAFKGYIDVIRVLLENGAKVDTRMPGGKTGLMFAAMFDRVDVLDLMLAHGADPTLVDDQGVTARQAAQVMGAEAAERRLQQAAQQR